MYEIRKDLEIPDGPESYWMHRIPIGLMDIGDSVIVPPEDVAAVGGEAKARSQIYSFAGYYERKVSIRIFGSGLAVWRVA